MFSYPLGAKSFPNFVLEMALKSCYEKVPMKFSIGLLQMGCNKRGFEGCPPSFPGKPPLATLRLESKKKASPLRIQEGFTAEPLTNDSGANFQ